MFDKTFDGQDVAVRMPMRHRDRFGAARGGSKVDTDDFQAASVP
jgi:hypothetical protein